MSFFFLASTFQHQCVYHLWKVSESSSEDRSGDLAGAEGPRLVTYNHLLQPHLQVHSSSLTSSFQANRQNGAEHPSGVQPFTLNPPPSFHPFFCDAPSFLTARTLSLTSPLFSSPLTSARPCKPALRPLQRGRANGEMDATSAEAHPAFRGHL